MNAFLAALYAEGYWVKSEVALKASQCLSRFLECYQACTRFCHDEGLNLFQTISKCHMLVHVVHRLAAEASLGKFATNPLAESVQMQEDFIGRPSRLSRRVSPRLVHLRCMQRYRLAAYQAIKDSDKDPRGL